MAHRRLSIGNRPFASLGDLLARNKIHLPEVRLPELPARPLTPTEEYRLFKNAMADVVPLAVRKEAGPFQRRYSPDPQDCEDPDAEALRKLRRLVETGEGFVVRHTAEYVEGGPEWMPPELFRRLHGGHFSIEAHLDLHGLNLAAARDDFNAFMRRVIASGKRAVLVVHGRGRCSPGPPVIKRQVINWLTRGTWKRWVIAFTSARPCDGGTGATVVLLRCRPRSGRRS
ncbi:Smr/MutS family protein [uncultured Desulfosarcina sp.]|uniref:Smr/MutS family protein n=1 Tax=uncultured Desulfosarcina sp. TaxID=218289 RepID=UPI0029C8297F|nr:Smr/MutS family protein [uncultured Desulfosarcina sp.]